MARTRRRTDGGGDGPAGRVSRALGLWQAAVGAIVLGCVATAESSTAEDLAAVGWQRIESRYCTLWLEPGIRAAQVTKRLRVRGIPATRPQSRLADTPEVRLAEACDRLFARARDLLEMFPPGIHVTVKVARHPQQIRDLSAARYGTRTEAVAFYAFENNTIYTSVRDLSESVLAHEMAHAIVAHYFNKRPSRAVEELAATYVNTHLRNAALPARTPDALQWQGAITLWRKPSPMISRARVQEATLEFLQSFLKSRTGTP